MFPITKVNIDNHCEGGGEKRGLRQLINERFSAVCMCAFSLFVIVACVRRSKNEGNSS